ncbi:MAG: ribosome small subunit-dependent GTPase A [Bacteroidales bacterium]|nr:ribosome small subunit-dependent GTPase A [Bacteroidales bacterium]
MEGIVTKSTGSWYIVKLDDGTRVECRLRGKFRTGEIRTTNPVAVGDRVRITMEAGKNTGVISEIKPRHNYMIRRSIKLSKASHIIAANIDQAWLVTTLAMPRTSIGFIDRFLITAEAYHIPATIIFNKIDIYDKAIMDILRKYKELYESIGYKCFAVSALRGDGIDDLKNELKGKTTLLSGHSGTGKSAIINSIEPGLDLRTSEISAYHHKGTHTTTFAEMFELSFGASIIDTPGIQEFSLTDFEHNEVWERFPEMRAISMGCQFNNCTHTHEPRCAVKQALENGTISRIRYQSYLSILNDEELDINEWE